jgi:hypothetical protein
MLCRHKKSVALITAVLSSLSWLTGCCHYPKARVSRNLPVISRPSGVTIVAYGDTRTGPWGLGDNAKQAIHGKIVTDILEHDQPINAVIFTGDAVMSNFFLWKKEYWRCFLCQATRFGSDQVPFYPSLGNHEVLSPIVPVMQVSSPAEETVIHPTTSQEIERAVSQAYDEGEEPTPAPVHEEQIPTSAQAVNPGSKEGQALLKQWEREIANGNTASAKKFGQFEHTLQLHFYTELDKDERCEADAKTFRADYLTSSKFAYLRPLLNGRSYYSKIVEDNGVRVKLIALDTNCLDSKQQQDFFAQEVNGFSDPIIIFGHHPPVDYSAPVGWPWDKVPGWGQNDDDPLKSYITNANGRKLLWVFGHVHDYQRRGPTTGSIGALPTVLIAGGGGASLDASAAGFQWQPKDWPQPLQISAYSQVRILITKATISVETRGGTDKGSPFAVIDSFCIPLLENACSTGSH